MRFMGLDIGTTSVCGVLIDTENPANTRAVTDKNAGFIQTGNAFEKRQDPAAILHTVDTIIAELSKDARPDAIGLTGQMHGIVYVDKDASAVSPLFTWQDARGDLPFRDNKSYAAFLSEQTGCSLASGYGVVTHFYQVQNGLVPPQAVAFCTIHDLCAMRLTGRKTPLVHISDAASIGLFDLHKNAFDLEAAARIGLDKSFFPAVSAEETLIGATPDGVPVSVAVGDNQASVLGSVKDLEKSVLVNVGTGSQVSCVVDKPVKADGIECRPLVGGKYLLVGSSLCGGRAYAVAERFLRDVVTKIAGAAVENVYSAMDELMKDYEGTASPLAVETTFDGTRTDPAKRGTISGIGVDNFTTEAFLDGVMNGMVEELYAFFGKMKPFLPSTPAVLVGSGNGIRQNKPLAKRFEKAFGCPVRIPVRKEEAAYGAALFASVAAGFYRNIEEAQQMIEYEGEMTP